MVRFYCYTAIVLCLVSLVGCGNGNGRLSGMIHIDGKPVEDGLIEFAPVDGKTALAAVKIVKGEYSVEVPPGEKIVKLYSYRVVGKAKVPSDPTREYDVTKQDFPENLNTKSTLRLSVQPGSQRFDYP